jgi:hypothetical protein
MKGKTVCAEFIFICRLTESLMYTYIHIHTHRHDFHHSHNVGAYGTMTCFWDWICGTDKAYREYYARKKEESSNGNGNGAAKKQK